MFVLLNYLAKDPIPRKGENKEMSCRTNILKVRNIQF